MSDPASYGSSLGPPTGPRPAGERPAAIARGSDDAITSKVEVEAGQVSGVGTATVDQTQADLAEEALRDSEERLRLALSAGAMATWDWHVPSGKVTWNEEHFRMLGYQPGAVTPGYQAWADRIHPEDRAETERLVQEAVAQGRDYRAEFRVRHPDGAVRWIEARGRTEVDAPGHPRRQYGVMLDVTDRKQVDASLGYTTGLLRTLIDNVDVGVALVDEDGRFAQYNRRFLDLFGLDAASTLANVNSTDWARWTVVSDAGQVLHVDEHPVRKAVLTGRPVRNQLVGVHRPGADTRIWMLVSAEGLATPRGTQVICTYQDVTGMREAEQALQETDRRRSQFLAVLSHELRNPLAPIRNAIQILDLAPAGSDQAQRAREVLHRQTEHLCRLVDDLLELTRITYGKIALQVSRLDAREVVRRACDDQAAGFERQGVRLACSVGTNPAWVQADGQRLAQVVGNLLGNALKFTPRGGEVHVEVSAARGSCQVSVRDTGMGIEAEDLEAIFEPFVQSRQTKRHVHGGLGIGLALARELMRQHGGTVRAASPGKDQGAEFVLALPLDAAPARPEAPVAAPEEGSLSILLVEDNQDAAATLAELLTLGGHRVMIASTGRAGISLASAQPPDVLICDVGLPDMDGYEVARAVRGSSPAPRPFAIALTGYAQEDDRRRALEAGFDAHLAKPASPEALAALLARARAAR